jgi:hypothetical protein
MSEQSPATSAGSTSPAGEGVSDEELTEQVGEQTSSDLEVEGAFERESDGASTDTEAAKATGDELQ